MSPRKPTTRRALLVLSAFAFLPVAANAQSQTSGSEVAAADANLPDAAPQKTGTQAGAERQQSAQITGKLVDQSDVPISGARVILRNDSHDLLQETTTAEDGQFAFSQVPPGRFQLAISASGLASRDISGSVRPGEDYAVPQITMTVAPVMTEVQVVPSQVEIAQEQIKVEEKQRALGLVPNYLVTYEPDAAPLSSKQKFELAWKMTIDPVNFAIVGVVAGVEQSQNDFAGYGQGAQGYAKRYGAAFATVTSNTMIGSAILPALLKQDPRYFYKGTGSIRSRAAYAIANAVICKGDNGRWQPNYSAIVGGLAAGGLANLYYPAQERNGVGLTFENALIGTAATAATNLLQEFLIRKLTPNAPDTDPVTGLKSPRSRPGHRVLGVFHREGD